MTYECLSLKNYIINNFIDNKKTYQYLIFNILKTCIMLSTFTYNNFVFLESNYVIRKETRKINLIRINYALLL